MCKLALIAALALAPAAATAGSPGVWQTGNQAYHLYLSDLDLHSIAGRAEALVRVERVARHICRGGGTASEEKTCVTKTIATSARGSALDAIQQATAERVSVRLADGRAK
jgi:UrcA family protein